MNYKLDSSKNWKWRWCFNGDWYSLTVHTMTAPSWFVRFMQKYCLGVWWERIEEENKE